MSQVIGVIGAGVMGKGVAERFAKYGYDIILIDNDEKVRKEAIANITRSIRVKCMFDKTINLHDIISRIHVTDDYNSVSDADFIIENVYEREDIKKKVYEKLADVTKKDCIYLANTSCISITRIGSYTKQPENVIGVHFMNPVPVKKFAEVIKGGKTSNETIQKMSELLNSVDISFEIINDSVGFVSNRLSHLFMNEAAMLVYEGIASPTQIDNIFKNGFGHTMGPLETADLIGIDTVVDSLDVIYKEYQDSKFRVCPLMKRMVEMGETGRKVKKGFYKY